MSIQDNPFYILGVSSFANRRTISVAVEEQSFLLDAEKCSVAQSILLNPNRRLSAEIDWFTGVSIERQEEIISNIKSKHLISIDDLSSLDKLNADLYNFEAVGVNILSDKDWIEPKYAKEYALFYKPIAKKLSKLEWIINDINVQYMCLNADEITETINISRNAAGLVPVQVEYVTEELQKKREGIRHSISKILSDLDQSEYISLVTRLAMKFNEQANHRIGLVISDIIDQYEINIQTSLEERAAKVREKIASIKHEVETRDNSILSQVSLLNPKITFLIVSVQEWDRLAQPLQLKSQASGMPHEPSERMGYEIRNLAISLHNDYGETKAALTLVDSMKGVFLELDGLIELFEEDSSTLHKILPEIKAEEAAQKVLSELNELKDIKKNALEIQTHGNTGVAYANKIKRINSSIKGLSLGDDLEQKIREGLFYSARETAVELHNTYGNTSAAITIITMLTVEFKDINRLLSKAENDKRVLLDEKIKQHPSNYGMSSLQSKAYSQANTSNKNKKSKIPHIIVALVVVAFIIGGIVTLYNDSDTSSASNTNTSSNSSSSNQHVGNNTSYPQESQYVGNESTGKDVYADIVSIFPEFGIYPENGNQYTDFVCRCETASGSEIWVYMTVQVFQDNFDASVNTATDGDYYADTIYLSPSKRIHGTTMRASYIVDDLPEYTTDIVIRFKSIS